MALARQQQPAVNRSLGYSGRLPDLGALPRAAAARQPRHRQAALRLGFLGPSAAAGVWGLSKVVAQQGWSCRGRTQSYSAALSQQWQRRWRHLVSFESVTGVAGLGRVTANSDPRPGTVPQGARHLVAEPAGCLAAAAAAKRLHAATKRRLGGPSRGSRARRNGSGRSMRLCSTASLRPLHWWQRAPLTTRACRGHLRSSTQKQGAPPTHRPRPGQRHGSGRPGDILLRRPPCRGRWRVPGRHHSRLRGQVAPGLG